MLKVFGFIASGFACLMGIISIPAYIYQGCFPAGCGIYSVYSLFEILTWIVFSIFLFVLSINLK